MNLFEWANAQDRARPARASAEIVDYAEAFLTRRPWFQIVALDRINFRRARERAAGLMEPAPIVDFHRRRA